METIKGAVDTASKVLFGDQHKTGEQGQHVEPQSGVTGNTTRGEPYDGGNIDDNRGTGLTGSSNTGTGSGLMGSSNTGSGLTGGGSNLSGGPSNAGPHESNILNKADPRVDSDRDGRSGMIGSSNTGSGSMGSSGGYGPSNSGPHDSNILNKADPRVDSDRDGRSGMTGSSHTGTTGGGLMGSSGGHGSSNAGPHDSNILNKADPRVDSDRDGRSNVSGQHNTQSQGGIGSTISQAASAVTGGAVGGAAANRGTDYNSRGTSGKNNNLNEYSMGGQQASRETQGQHGGQPGIAYAEHRDDTHRHQGANDPLDQPSHRESHAIRDTKDEAERKLDPRNDDSSHGPRSSSGIAGQDPHSVRQGSLTGHLPGAAGGEGLQKTTGEGTGKQYVKSTGLAAEGGDFDASRPGAGKEADRLLDSHGISHGAAKPSHGQDEASSKMAGGHTTSGTHSHGAHTGASGTLGSHDHRDVETSSTTAIRDGVPGQSTGTHTSTTGAHSGSHGTHGTHDTTGAHSGGHGEGPLHADLSGVRHEPGHGKDGMYGTVAEGTTDEKPSLKDKIKAKIHMS